MREETYRYWGLYCPQHNNWLQDTSGRFFQFSAPSIAESYRKTALGENGHLFEVTEFGTEKPADLKSLPSGSALCAR